MEIKKKITHRYLRFLRSLNASGGTLVSLLLSRYLNWCMKKVSKNNWFTLRCVPMSTLLMHKTFTSNSLLPSLIHSQSERTNVLMCTLDKIEFSLLYLRNYCVTWLMVRKSISCSESSTFLPELKNIPINYSSTVANSWVVVKEEFFYI